VDCIFPSRGAWANRLDAPEVIAKPTRNSVTLAKSERGDVRLQSGSWLFSRLRSALHFRLRDSAAVCIFGESRKDLRENRCNENVHFVSGYSPREQVICAAGRAAFVSSAGREPPSLASFDTPIRFAVQFGLASRSKDRLESSLGSVPAFFFYIGNQQSSLSAPERRPSEPAEFSASYRAGRRAGLRQVSERRKFQTDFGEFLPCAGQPAAVYSLADKMTANFASYFLSLREGCAVPTRPNELTFFTQQPAPRAAELCRDTRAAA